MRIVALSLAIITLLFFSLVSTPLQAALVAAPPVETLAGLTPGLDTVDDAVARLGGYDGVLAGEATYYAGGSRATQAYEWAPGSVLGMRAIVVETGYRSRVIDTVLINGYPGLATSRGLMTLMPEDDVLLRYGLPDFAFNLGVGDETVRELYYLREGLLVLLRVLPGRPNWTVTQLILTYPLNLRTAVASRERDVRAARRVEDITRTYRVWARMALTGPDGPTQ